MIHTLKTNLFRCPLLGNLTKKIWEARTNSNYSKSDQMGLARASLEVRNKSVKPVKAFVLGAWANGESP